MKRVMMLLANGVEPLEMAVFTDVLGWASLIGTDKIQLVDVGLRSHINTTFGLKLQPNFLLRDVDLDSFDALVIPGGFEDFGYFDEALSSEFLSVIRYFSAVKKIVASVCVASLALGEAGVLNGKKATTYHQIGGKRKQRLTESGAIFVDEPIVNDCGFITSSGPGTAIEVALTLLEQLTSKTNAKDIRTRMRIPTPNQQWYQAPQVNPGLGVVE